MCTIFKRDTHIDDLNNLIKAIESKKEKVLETYKVLKVVPIDDFECMLTSLLYSNSGHVYQEIHRSAIIENIFIWKNGINSSNRIIPQLTSEELTKEYVEIGLHSYLNLKDAIKTQNAIEDVNMNIKFHNSAIVRIQIDPHDIICTGYWKNDLNMPCIVSTKANLNVTSYDINKLIRSKTPRKKHSGLIN